MNKKNKEIFVDKKYFNMVNNTLDELRKELIVIRQEINKEKEIKNIMPKVVNNNNDNILIFKHIGFGSQNPQQIEELRIKIGLLMREYNTGYIEAYSLGKI